MSYSISIASIEKSKVYNAVGEALINGKQVGFADAIDIAHTINTLAYGVGGDMVSVSASGHRSENGSNGYFSVSLGYNPKPVEVDPTLSAPKSGAVEPATPVEAAPVVEPAPAVESGPLETSEGAVASEPAAAIVEPVQDAPAAA